jgi:hypothetical protein
VNERQIEGRLGLTIRGGRRHKQLLDYFKKMRGSWKLKEETPDSHMWRTRFG